jgi:hypothetical protein
VISTSSSCAALLCQYAYFCTSKASKLSTCASAPPPAAALPSPPPSRHRAPDAAPCDTPPPPPCSTAPAPDALSGWRGWSARQVCPGCLPAPQSQKKREKREYVMSCPLWHTCAASSCVSVCTFVLAFKAREARVCDVVSFVAHLRSEQLRQYLYLCASSCVSICTFVLANLDTHSAAPLLQRQPACPAVIPVLL